MQYNLEKVNECYTDLIQYILQSSYLIMQGHKWKDMSNLVNPSLCVGDDVLWRCRLKINFEWLPWNAGAHTPLLRKDGVGFRKSSIINKTRELMKNKMPLLQIFVERDAKKKNRTLLKFIFCNYLSAWSWTWPWDE